MAMTPLAGEPSSSGSIKVYNPNVRIRFADKCGFGGFSLF
jgi:hypothetical protein